MKNFVFIFSMLIFVTACSEPKAKNYECKKYSPDCELQKDRILMRPISFDSTLIDAYGNQIDPSRWYVMSTKAKVLIPTLFPIRTSCDPEGGCNYDNNPSPEFLLKKLKEEDPNIRLETINMTSILDKEYEASVVIFGPNEAIMEARINKTQMASAK